MAKNNIIISINTKMTIKMFAKNNRIIIKESFAAILNYLSSYWSHSLAFKARHSPHFTHNWG